MPKRLTSEDYHTLAQSRGFEWLGEGVVTTKTKTRWRCPNGHEWETWYHNIKHRGCPFCAPRTQKTPPDYHNLATSRGFEWLGPEVQNVQSKTRWRCPNGHEWETRYNAIKQGWGCPICSPRARKTSLHYHNLATSRGFEWLGPEVQKVTLKTRWRCKQGHVWEARYKNIQDGRGCHICSQLTATAKRRNRPEDYRTLAQSRGFEWLGPKVASNKTNTRWRCQAGHEWEANYNGIKNGNGCAHCSGKAQRLPADYHTLAQSRGLEWLGPEAQNAVTRTGWRCEQGHEWEASYSQIQQRQGCGICSRLAATGKRRLKPEDYHALAQSRGFEWLGPEVQNNQSKTKWRCEQGHEWDTCYSQIQRGCGCSLCNASRGETVVAFCLDRVGIPYERERRFRLCRGEGGRPLPFDFFFRYHNISFLVEYDGRHHYEPDEYFGGEERFASCQRHDAIKTGFAADNGYILIRIPYTVEQIETYLITAVAHHTGLTFDQVAVPAQRSAAGGI